MWRPGRPLGERRPREGEGRNRRGRHRGHKPGQGAAQPAGEGAVVAAAPDQAAASSRGARPRARTATEHRGRRRHHGRDKNQGEQRDGQQQQERHGKRDGGHGDRNKGRSERPDRNEGGRPPRRNRDRDRAAATTTGRARTWASTEQKRGQQGTRSELAVCQAAGSERAAREQQALIDCAVLGPRHSRAKDAVLRTAMRGDERLMVRRTLSRSSPREAGTQGSIRSAKSSQWNPARSPCWTVSGSINGCGTRGWSAPAAAAAALVDRRPWSASTASACEAVEPPGARRATSLTVALDRSVRILKVSRLRRAPRLGHRRPGCCSRI